MGCDGGSVSSKARFGWNTARTRHVVPGRLLLAVSRLQHNPSLAAHLSKALCHRPGIRAVHPSVHSGRVCVQFDDKLVEANTVERWIDAAVGESGCGEDTPKGMPPPQANVSKQMARPAHRRHVEPGATGAISKAPVSVIPLVAVRPGVVHRWVQNVLAGANRHLRLARPVGRRQWRLLGKRGFDVGRMMQRRGEYPVCIVKNGHPVALVGVQPSARNSKIHGTSTDKAAVFSDVAATVDTDGMAPPKGDERAWHTLDAEAIMTMLSTGGQGLDSAEARARLQRAGPNAIPRPARLTPFRQFVEECRDPMNVILLCAVALSLLLGQFVDAAIITSIVAVNALLAVVQNGRTHALLKGLDTMASPTARVQRYGSVKVIPTEELVSGDMVHLEAGDYVPADIRLVEDMGLVTTEAALTGESADVTKKSDALCGEVVGIADRCNMVYMGTYVRQGRGRGIVVATGLETEMGRVARLVGESKPGPTPLQRRLHTVNRAVVFAVLVSAFVMLVVGLLQGLPFGWLAIAAVSTAVAAIPEGLPVTVSIALAAAAFRMGRRHASVRSLPAVETLGSTTVICTDKTGTLTENRMRVVEVWAGGRVYEAGDGPAPEGLSWDAALRDDPDADDFVHALRIATLCSNASVAQTGGMGSQVAGDATEAALMSAAIEMGVAHTHEDQREVRLHELPFDPTLRRMTVVCQDEVGDIYAHVKGAPDALLPLCTHWRNNGRVEVLDAATRRRITERAETMAAAGQRVLAVGYRQLSADWEHLGESGWTENLVFAGVFGLIDPPRPDVPAALDACKRAGIKVIMMTGDHAATAVAMARRLNMVTDEEDEGFVLTGQAIDEMNDADLAAALERTVVCARVAPVQKLRIVRALQAQGHVVAMTGDGVNDAPAVRAADVGVAMGRTGTELTRSAADIQLLDDRFSTIVDAVREGRGAFDNIRRTVRYTLATNVAEVVLMLGAVLMGLPLPLLPVHLLWVNLVCDGLPALALSFDHPAPDTLAREPERTDGQLFGRSMWARVAVRGAILGLGTLFLFHGLLSRGLVTLARSAALASIVMGKMMYLVEVQRWTKPAAPSVPSPLPVGPNTFLRWAVGLSVGLFLVTLYVPALRHVFGVAGLNVAQWMGVIAVCIAGFVGETALFRRRRGSPAEYGPLGAGSKLVRQWAIPRP